MLTKQTRHRANEKIKKSPAKKATETWRSKYLYHLNETQIENNFASWPLAFCLLLMVLPAGNKHSPIKSKPFVYRYHGDHSRTPTSCLGWHGNVMGFTIIFKGKVCLAENKQSSGKVTTVLQVFCFLSGDAYSRHCGIFPLPCHNIYALFNLTAPCDIFAWGTTGK